MSYNKMKFDRSPFNKASKSDQFGMEIISTGDFQVKLQVISPLPEIKLSGLGEMGLQIVMQQNVGVSMDSKSALNMGDTVLSMDISSKIIGESSMGMRTHVKSPFDWAVSGTGGASMDERMFLYQTIDAPINSVGDVKLNINMVTMLHLFKLNGDSAVNFGVDLQLPLTIRLEGLGDLDLRRLGALNENTIELIGVDIQPGQTVTIDTDLLQVLVGAIEDVSSVTTESVFFELNPGENEITVRTDTNQSLEVVAIWQNRWL